MRKVSSKGRKGIHFKNKLIQFSEFKECPYGNLVECSLNISLKQGIVLCISSWILILPMAGTGGDLTPWIRQADCVSMYRNIFQTF